MLFTAFEPSGDALAAPIIAELIRQRPDLEVVAVGGEQMEQAGATMLGRTTGEAAMGADALKRVGAVRRQMRMLKRWSRTKPVKLHVPVDSPAANFPIAKMLRRQGVRTVHLVAPQIWAWG
ncbi:MAG: lipid-A-disaccharide synthase, partial [Planctomycetota bacterium]